jgi:hypothetical protein
MPETGGAAEASAGAAAVTVSNMVGCDGAIPVCADGGFLLDSIGSIASGQASNAAFNAGVLLLAAGPLWWKAWE